MRKNDIQLLSEAYSVTRRPRHTFIIESQLNETLEILQEGMWDRLKSDAAGATTGMGKKAIGTLGRAATLGIGGKYNPFNKMVAQGRQAGQEARAASLGKSHSAKLTKEMDNVTRAFNKAIDNYIADMEKQKLITPGQVNQQTNALKTEFGNSLQKSQQTVDGLVQQATSMTQAGADGKTQGGMAQQQVGGAGTGDDSGLTAAGTAINKNVIQPAKTALQNTGQAVGDQLAKVPGAVSDAAGAARTALNKVPGQVVQGVGDLSQQLQNVPGQVKKNFQVGQANAQARAGTAPAEGEAPATPGADTTAKVGELKDEIEGEKKPSGMNALKSSNLKEENEEPEDDTPAEGSGSELLGYNHSDWEAEDPDQAAMDREEEEEKVSKEQVDPLNPVFPYTYLNESNVQAYADNMNPGWQRDDLKSGRDSRLL